MNFRGRGRYSDMFVAFGAFFVKKALLSGEKSHFSANKSRFFGFGAKHEGTS